MISRKPGVNRRTNEQWLSDLKGANGVQAQELAYLELGRYAWKCAYNHLRVVAYRYAALAELPDEALGDYALDFAQLTLEKIATDNGELLAQFRNESPFTSWAAKIAINVVRSELRKQQYQSETSAPAINDGNESGDNDPLDKVWAAGHDPTELSPHNPENQVEQHELRQALAHCLEALPERERNAFWAQEIEGQTGGQIAAQMKTSRNAVFILLSNARKRLRACLQQSGYQTRGRA